MKTMQETVLSDYTFMSFLIHQTIGFLKSNGETGYPCNEIARCNSVAYPLNILFSWSGGGGLCNLV